MVGTTPTIMTPQLPHEDAVAIATDFFHCKFGEVSYTGLSTCLFLFVPDIEFTALDNVSNEVEHILKEIAYKDERMTGEPMCLF
jgi:hypothetical protein